MGKRKPDYHRVQIPTVKAHPIDSCDIRAINSGASTASLVVFADNYLGACRYGSNVVVSFRLYALH